MGRAHGTVLLGFLEALPSIWEDVLASAWNLSEVLTKELKLPV